MMVSTGKQPEDKPLQGVENMMEDKSMSMTANELQEFKATLLKADRLEALLILQNCKSIEEAVEAFKIRALG